MIITVKEKKVRPGRYFLKGILKTGVLFLFSIGFLFPANGKPAVYKNIVTPKINAEVERLSFKTITGTVTDENGNPVAGAVVSVSNSKASAVTADNGTFKIEANEGDVLTVSHISFLSASYKIGSNNHITITLEQNLNNLEQVVITGYT